MASNQVTMFCTLRSHTGSGSFRCISESDMCKPFIAMIFNRLVFLCGIFLQSRRFSTLNYFYAKKEDDFESSYDVLPCMRKSGHGRPEESTFPPTRGGPLYTVRGHAVGHVFRVLGMEVCTHSHTTAIDLCMNLDAFYRRRTM